MEPARTALGHRPEVDEIRLEDLPSIGLKRRDFLPEIVLGLGRDKRCRGACGVNDSGGGRAATEPAPMNSSSPLAALRSICRRRFLVIFSAEMRPVAVGSTPVTSVFNSARKNDNLLSHRLWSIVKQSQLPDRVNTIQDLNELDKFEKDLPSALDGIRPIAPKLGDPRPASVRENGGAWVPVVGSSDLQSTTRHYLAVKVEGDHELCTCWPDDTDEDIAPLDTQVQEESASWSRSWGRAERDKVKAAEEMWVLSTTGDPGADGVWALYTFFDLTNEEEAAAGPGGSIDLHAKFMERYEEAARIVNQVARQAARYFDEELPQWFKREIERRREILTNRAGVTQTLKFSNEWVVPAPQLASSTTVGATNQADVQPEAEASGVDAVVRVNMRARLAPASFEDVQRVIRVWADALERYPAAYRDLGEDRISDLLAATLNATLPGANREVYSREGKSDIFIKADSIAEGTGPAKVFICENKRASADKVVQEAVDPQLFGYLTVHDTAAVLLLLLEQQGFDKAVKARLRALRKVVGYQSEKLGPSGWPIFKYVHEGKHVELCVATVHIPKKRKRRASTSVNPPRGK
ncbi:hypothetical protein [Rhodococcus oryzae]|uniref:hypothetical protein n=1 Tax=Rhodococcus oryzae TaxID=2571143 RepID=UPI003797D344